MHDMSVEGLLGQNSFLQFSEERARLALPVVEEALRLGARGTRVTWALPARLWDDGSSVAGGRSGAGFGWARRLRAAGFALVRVHEREANA